MSYDAEPNHAVCPRCNGEGYVFDDHDGELAEVADKCPQCEGDGWVYATSKPAESASAPREDARELAIACLEWDKPITFPSEQRQVERAAAEIERYTQGIHEWWKAQYERDRSALVAALAAERGRAERAEAVSEEEYSRGFNNGARASHSALVAIIEDKEKDIEVAEAEAKALREALTPSEITKAAYIGEFEFPVKAYDEDGEELTFPATVPWTTIKEIMAAILARALDGSGKA